MKEQLFVIGDVHGEIGMLRKLLEFWEPSSQRLIFIGDIIDRGENPKECLEVVQQLIKEEEAICLAGNHEDLLFNFLSNPQKYGPNYFLNGGWKTVETLLEEPITNKNPLEMVRQIKDRYPELVPFLKFLPYHYEWDSYLFVHAGVDLTKDHWQETNPSDFLWIREEFHKGKNHTGKKIVFGHTPTFLLHQDQTESQLWMEDDKIGIDGGAVFGGTLHGIVFDKHGMVHRYGIKKDDSNELITEVYL